MAVHRDDDDSKAPGGRTPATPRLAVATCTCWRDARIDIIWNARDLELSDEARLALWLQKRIPTTGLGEA